MTEIMCQLVALNIQFLPVHDAVYVSVSQAEMAQIVMESVFSEMAGVDGIVKAIYPPASI